MTGPHCKNPSCRGGQEHVIVFLDTPIAAYVRMVVNPNRQPNTVTLREPCHLCRAKTRERWEEHAGLARLPGQPNMLRRINCGVSNGR